MTDQNPRRRPIGWYLKQADAQLDQLFDVALTSHNLTRREWQILETVASSSPTVDALIEVLAPFENEPGIRATISALVTRDILSVVGGDVELTPGGAQLHGEASAAVLVIRSTVASALPANDYAELIRLLDQLIQNLSAPARRP